MNALIIALTDLKRLMRERVALFWIFVGPLIFTTFFGILFRPQTARPVSVALVNHDQDSYIADTLTALLKADNIILTKTDTVPSGSWVLEVPQGAASAMAANQPVKVVLRAPEEENNAERSLRFKLQKALTTIYLQANPADKEADAGQGALEQRLARDQLITIRRADIGVQRREMTAGFQRSVPSYLIMFVFLNLLVSGAGIAEERASGKLRRLFVAPVSKRDIVLGKLLRRMAIGWIQVSYMLLLGVFVFKIRWADHTWVLFAFLTLFALASASLGMLLGTLFKDPDKCRTVAVWTAILLSPLGGLWWPLEIVGPTMRKVAYVVPTGWAMESVNSMLAFGDGAREVAPFALAFAAMAMVCLSLASRRLKP